MIALLASVSGAAQNLPQVFDRLLAGSSEATAPMLALGIGVLVFLVADILPGLAKAKPVIFLASIGFAFAAELRILGMETPPGSVLDGSLTANTGTAIWGCLFLAGTLLAWTYSRGYYREDKPFEAEHDALMLAAPVGMMLMVGAGDLVTFFIGLELLSIPLYALAAFRRARTRSVEAGLKYFILGTFASGFLLYGSSLLYAATGTVSLERLAAADIAGSPMALAGSAFITASIFFKVSVFPFHLWVPDVYEGSPTPVTALMATGTKAAAFGFLIEAMGILPTSAVGTIAAVALLTMVAGNLGALVQDDLKRMLAYSGVAHAGTLLLVVAGGLALGDAESARNAALVYMAAYVFTATGAFGLLALLESDGERFTKLSSLRGLAHSRPGVAAALALFMLSLGGIPATGGFLGKWFVFSVLVEADMIGVAVMGVLLSVVALGYYLRVIVTIYMEPPAEAAPPTTTRPLTAGLATLVCSAFVLLIGLLPGWLLDHLG